ncbi:23S rRNA (guanosine(2251)-2'-O)-methyltransferase RlmB [Aureibaculum sp. 2210JD6-5]|uniref:23S rRNA (guanosine(2251)-2'-O)-methyltransferase RlmB n=1 Tax=Aureibaculum sp. 2210JD6-5 TaxID=3103957 RepID=UPI002AADAAF0|nr:23S rRNA (guanosine(2251)-2'-O)-methyltransferase RlmB [Aureibaculum sp. 2210JD6-5]MDY7394410.1 23S rRNA (guanosine(2251)-2'-O)-methyltransferase RlmB [Aureibaculum sp. 2210JD6-5]
MQETSNIFGIRAIIEAINAGQTLEKIYIQKGLTGHLFSELNTLIKQHNISSSYVPIEKLNHLSKNKNHQGVVGKISAVDFYSLEDIIASNTKENPLYLLLDQITDVRNFGAILRTSECTGVDAVIIPNQSSAPLNADAIKTSAGAAFKIPICKVNHLLDAIYFLQAEGIQIVAITEKTDGTIYEVELNKPTALILGSEHKGISPSILKIADAKAKLPLLGDIASLNVSVACGVALYEVVRQRISLQE